MSFMSPIRPADVDPAAAVGFDPRSPLVQDAQRVLDHNGLLVLAQRRVASADRDGARNALQAAARVLLPQGVRMVLSAYDDPHAVRVDHLDGTTTWFFDDAPDIDGPEALAVGLVFAAYLEAFGGDRAADCTLVASPSH